LRIDEIKGDVVVTSYTRWLVSVEVRGAENPEVYLTFSPNFERIWLGSKKRLPEYVSQKPANLGLRSQYALQLYGWAKKYVTVGKKGISLPLDGDNTVGDDNPIPFTGEFDTLVRLGDFRQIGHQAIKRSIRNRPK
jgi:hypothetical protein